MTALLPRSLGLTSCPPDKARAQLSEVVHITLETLRVCGLLLQPVMPHSMDQLLTRLNVPHNNRSAESAVFGAHRGGHALGPQIGHLFKKHA